MIKPLAAYAIQLWPEAQIWVAEDGHGWRRSQERERHLFWLRNIGRHLDPEESVKRMGDGSWADMEGQLLLTAIAGRGRRGGRHSFRITAPAAAN